MEEEAVYYIYKKNIQKLNIKLNKRRDGERIGQQHTLSSNPAYLNNINKTG